MLNNMSIIQTCRKFSSSAPISFKLALVQMRVGDDKSKNLSNAKKLVETAVRNNANVVALPECFINPLDVKKFKELAENIPDGPSCDFLKDTAKRLGIHLIGGTIPEKENNKLYNTCTVWSPSGELLTKYRKMHLCDIDIPNGVTFIESKLSNPGNKLGIFCIGDVKVGLGICYDLRFEELAKVYRMRGAKILMYPAAFNISTGSMHWSSLQKGRAIDNQVFVASICPAREKKGFIAYGHSQIINPWGKVIAEAGVDEEIVYADINLSECDEVREQVPIFTQRRLDIYDTIEKL